LFPHAGTVSISKSCSTFSYDFLPGHGFMTAHMFNSICISV